MVIDPQIAPFYDVTFLLCGQVFCEDCHTEIPHESAHPEYTDENYYDQAVSMYRNGWTVNGVAAYCPKCSHGR